jgi:hypothetical protein
MKEIIYKSFNQFNYSIKAIKINYENKSFIVYYGGQCPIHYDKKTTTKFINNKIEELKLMKFEEVKF